MVSGRILVTGILALLVAGGLIADARAAASEPFRVAQAQTDPAVVQALEDIAKYEGLVAKMKPGDVKTGQSYIDQMQAIEKSLMALPDKKHPKWREAAQRYLALQKKIVATANKGGKKLPADPVVYEVLKAVEDYEAKVAKMAPGDATTGKRYLKELGPIGAKLKGAKNRGHPDWRTARERYNAINKKIVAVANQKPGALDLTGLASVYQTRLKRLDRSVARTRDNIQRTRALDFAEASKVNTFRNSINSYKGQLTKFPDQNQAGVKTVAGRIAALGQLLDSRVAESAGAKKEAGEIDGQLAAIDQYYRQNPVPQAFDPEKGPEAAAAYATKMRELRAKSQEAGKTLDRIQAAGFKSDSTGKHKIGSMRHWVVNDRQRSVNNSVQASIQKIDANVDRYMGTVDFHKSTDPKKKDHQANRLLGEGQAAENREAFAKGLAAVKTAAAFDKALGRRGAPDRAAQEKAFRDGAAKYEKDLKAALSNVRMPKPAMTDSKYIKIAKETLANPKYESVNPHERLVINSKIQRKEKKEGDIRGNRATQTATVTIYHWVWDEFQVATAEKVGNDYFIFYNTLKFFHKGAPTTPTGRWVLSGRFQSTQIPKENIKK